MATKINDIKAVNWQLSARAIGEVSEGLDDIRQCIQIILTTRKGSDPLRPLFGSNIYQHIDKPVNLASALISSEILDSVANWETRIEIQSIVHNTVKNRIDFQINCLMRESGETTQILFSIDKNKQAMLPPIGHAFSDGFSDGFS